MLRIAFRLDILDLPHRVTAREALEFYRRGFFESNDILLMAANWRAFEEDDDGDFEELNSDERDDEDFLDDFANATLELWPN